VWSVAAWAVAVGVGYVLALVRDWSFSDGAVVSALGVGVAALAYGGVGLGGGGVHMSPGPTGGRVRVDPRRERVSGDSGTLTPLGLALFIAPQMFLFAALVG
jgi:hypothetical protein